MQETINSIKTPELGRFSLVLRKIFPAGRSLSMKNPPGDLGFAWVIGMGWNFLWDSQTLLTPPEGSKEENSRKFLPRGMDFPRIEEFGWNFFFFSTLHLFLFRSTRRSWKTSRNSSTSPTSATPSNCSGGDPRIPATTPRWWGNSRWEGRSLHGFCPQGWELEGVRGLSRSQIIP